MMKRTDRYFRRLLRIISRHAMLYTEMISTGAMLHGGRGQQAYEASQSPLGLQLGGSDPDEMARCAVLAEEIGYDEININVGCPSSRVAAGAFGACLMLSPQRVADCVNTMSARVSIPVTVKCRIGVEQGRKGRQRSDDELFADLCGFVETVSKAGCATLVVHARKAILSGLTPKQNRKIPELRYDLVKALKREFQSLEIILNGGLGTLEEAKREAAGLDGVMIGRAAYKNPMLLAEVDSLFYGEEPARVSRREIVEEYLDYLRDEIRRGAPVSITRHLTQWFHGKPEPQRLLNGELLEQI